MDVGWRVGTRFPKQDRLGYRNKEEWTAHESFVGGFPTFAQTHEDDRERKPGGVCGERTKPREQRLLSGRGFLQARESVRKCSPARTAGGVEEFSAGVQRRVNSNAVFPGGKTAR